jgi:hypothetical protein
MKALILAPMNVLMDLLCDCDSYEVEESLAEIVDTYIAI